MAQKRTKGVVFLAWGSPAAKRVQKVDKKKNLVLFSVHPSPLSASRGWFDCGHFKKTNEWLRERYGEGEEIDWSLNGEKEGQKPVLVKGGEEKGNSGKVAKAMEAEQAATTAEKEKAAKEEFDDDFDDDEEAWKEVNP